MIGIACILIMIVWPRINKVIPGSMIALIVSTFLVQIFDLPVDTIGSRFTNISSSIPIPTLPHFSIAVVNKLFIPAVTIAILGALESLLSAVVSDEMIDDTHDSNMELVAQGIANITSGLFGGIPATGAIARTAANIKSGGRSSISGMVHAVTLLFTMLLLMPLAKMIPMPTLSAILIIVAYNMSGWRTFRDLLKAPKSDITVLLITFGCTVIFDLVVAIGIGMIMTMALFMKRVTDTTQIKDLVYEQSLSDDLIELLDKSLGKINIYQVNGPMFFGIIQGFIKKIKELNASTEVLILDMRHTHAIDASAVDAICKLHRQCEKLKIKLFLTHIQEQPMSVLIKMDVVNKLGEKNIYKSKTEAIEDAYQYIQKLIV